VREHKGAHTRTSACTRKHVTTQGAHRTGLLVTYSRSWSWCYRLPAPGARHSPCCSDTSGTAPCPPRHNFARQSTERRLVYLGGRLASLSRSPPSSPARLPARATRRQARRGSTRLPELHDKSGAAGGTPALQAPHEARPAGRGIGIRPFSSTPKYLSKAKKKNIFTQLNKQPYPTRSGRSRDSLP
jgi:hypothetical protein